MDFIITTFILVTCIVMLSSVWLTHKLAGYLKLDIKLKPLLLCALCALLINFFLPSVPSATTQYHILVVCGSILFFAFFIAYYNEKLIANHLPESTRNSEPPPDTPLAAISPEETPDAAHLEMLAVKEFLTEMVSVHDTWLEDTFEEKNAAEEDAPTAKKATTERKAKANAFLWKRLFQNRRGAARKQRRDAAFKKLTALDDLLDYAEEKKRRHAYPDALAAFQKAMHLYENDGYAPFIAIEMGNLYKNTGFYDKAIVIYNKAEKLPSVSEDPALREEFQNNISYLRIVKTILQRHNCSHRAFNDISEEIMGEIETEFAHWRAQNMHHKN